ncbi:MAG: hypothetical protein GVY25_12480 [Bacteroidetes bacterium]|jgi:hypothetical protein|nr:hypothetical protein [Bacteroidota bacterium]
MMFVTREWDVFFVLLAVLVALSVALYLVWYRHLPGAVDLALAADTPDEEGG